MPCSITKTGIALAIACALSVPVAQAQEMVLEEVVVTAQKRIQTLEDVPMAVSAITGDTVNDYLGGSQDIPALAGQAYTKERMENFITRITAADMISIIAEIY